MTSSRFKAAVTILARGQTSSAWANAILRDGPIVRCCATKLVTSWSYRRQQFFVGRTDNGDQVRRVRSCSQTDLRSSRSACASPAQSCLLLGRPILTGARYQRSLWSNSAYMPEEVLLMGILLIYSSVSSYHLGPTGRFAQFFPDFPTRLAMSESWMLPLVST